jgi:hypothetical protein
VLITIAAMSSYPNPNWFSRAFRALLPNAAWDGIKLLAIAGGAGMLAWAYRIVAFFRGLPQDRIIDIAIFAFSFLLLLSAYLISRRRRHGESNQSEVSGKSVQVEQAKAKILIATPIEGEAVGLHQYVRGYVFPPNSDLQVLVYAGDGRWYLQPDVEVEGYRWSVECQFGNKQSRDGGTYKLIAALGDQLTEERYKTLPEGLIQSNLVKVRRLAELDAKAQVVIVSPRHNDAVDWHHLVQGFVTPPDTPVQVLVSSNGPWRLQRNVDVSGSLWSVECTFGDKDKLLDCFNLIAVIGDQLSEGTYDVPPTDLISSNVVSVQRRPIETKCPDRRLHEIAEDDKKQIRDRFKIIGVRCITHLGEIPFIEFLFGLYNIGLCPVSIDDVMEGRIVFYRDRQSEGVTLSRTPIMGANLAMNCSFRSEGRFLIRQEVSPEEAAFIERSPDGSFLLADLRITMHGEEASGVRLECPFMVSKDGYYWTDHPASIFGEAEFPSALHRKELA